jgi:hypothetical protein
MPERRDFLMSSGATGDFYEEIIDSSPRIRQHFPAMALKPPYLPLNPHGPRAFGGMGAEGMKKEIPSNCCRWGKS